MKIFSAAQIKSWDRLTLQSRNISEIELMNQAAQACADWLIPFSAKFKQVYIFCGKGNNGGDGLTIARLLFRTGISVSVFRVNGTYSASNETQASMLPDSLPIQTVETKENFPVIPPDTLIIDALLGIGMKGTVSGNVASLIHHINQANAKRVAIDIASGVEADNFFTRTAVHADYTLTFEQYKLAHFSAHNDEFNGEVIVVAIGLVPQFIEQEPSIFELVEKSFIRSMIKKRPRFSHKGTYGHAAIIAGSHGMMGAAALAASGCLASGVGKLTCHVPDSGYNIIQTLVPEALCRTSGTTTIKDIGDTTPYKAIGVGPGMGIHNNAYNLLQEIFIKRLPTVIDADALNVMAQYLNLFQMLPENAVLTPHPGEFERLFGTGNNFNIALEKAQQHHMYVVLKGKFTLVATPEGKGYFIPTGNPGMAKGGMGDALTGIITGLLAQGYSGFESALMGTYLHGLAGDIAAEALSQQYIQANDVIRFMANAWKAIQDNADS
jgi:NAD(P)H-hydrate epimerase